MMLKPRLRDISVQPADMDGLPVIILQDPERLSDQTLCLPRTKHIYFIMSHFDGEHSLQNISEDFEREFGATPPMEQFVELVDALDSALFLHNERFLSHRQARKQRFLEDPIRRSSLAGSSYPPEKERLTQLMKSMREAGAQATKNLVGLDHSPLSGLISPHIDFMRGGKVYGAGWNCLPPGEVPDLAVILGTLHQNARSAFIPTRKAFETPLGILPTDTEILDQLQEALPGPSLYREEEKHLGEHSIEFQVLWLQHIYGPDSGVKILPILCPSLEGLLHEGQSPENCLEHKRFLDRLRMILDRSGKKCLIIAGADLSHVGPFFGDPDPVDSPLRHAVRNHDHMVLEAACSGDAQKFFHAASRDNSRYRICGLAPIYALLALLPATRGLLIDYDQATDDEASQSVSFASVAFP